ncbi:MAG: hypothetical protein JSV49_02045, partial [Thermoplasmata archaeon]
IIDSFMGSEIEFEIYQSGWWFSPVEVEEDVTSYSSPEILLDSSYDWYFVLSNLDTMQTVKSVEVKIELYQPRKDNPYVRIDSPLNNSVAFVGSSVKIEGSVKDDDGIRSLTIQLIEVSTGTVKLEQSLKHQDEYWDFDWDTSKYVPGVYRVKVTAEDTKGLVSTAQIFINLILAGAPEIAIINPGSNEQIEIGEVYEVNGTCVDNGYLVSLTIQFGTENPISIISSYANGNWMYFWDTKFESAGFLEIIISVEDDDDNIASRSVIVELIEPPIPPDTTAPEVTILTPVYGSNIEIGSTVTVAGYVYEERELSKLTLKLGSGHEGVAPTILSDGEWSYVWDTGSESPGKLLLSAFGEDASGNVGYANISVELVAPPPPSDTEAPIIDINTPVQDAMVSAGSILEISGTVRDNFGVTKMELSYDDGETWHDLTSSIVGIQWRFVLNTNQPLLWPNLYVINVRAYDTADNEGAEELSIVIIDDTLPVLEILTPDPGSTFKQSESIELSGFATDNFDVEKVQLKLNDARRFRDYSRNYNPDTGAWSIDLEGGELAIGTNTIYIKAVDIFGNEKEEILNVNIEAAPAKEDSGNAVDNTMDYFFKTRQGMGVCAILGLIIIVVALAVLSSGRRGQESKSKRKEERRKRKTKERL